MLEDNRQSIPISSMIFWFDRIFFFWFDHWIVIVDGSIEIYLKFKKIKNQINFFFFNFVSIKIILFWFEEDCFVCFKRFQIDKLISKRKKKHPTIRWCERILLLDFDEYKHHYVLRMVMLVSVMMMMIGESVMKSGEGKKNS